MSHPVTQPKNDRIIVRDAKPEDIPFVYSSWLRSYKHDSPITRFIHKDIFFKEHQKLLHKLLSHERTKVAVACDSEDPDLIFGYVAFEPYLIHYLYVKGPFRHLGIAHQLLQTQGLELMHCEISHLTYDLIRLLAVVSYPKYNPYRLVLGES